MALSPTMTTTWRLALLLALLFVLLPWTSVAQDVSYCSSQNTDSNDAGLYDQFQSNGWCRDTCNAKGTFAYGIILSHNCWCSNYAPQDQQDTSKCSDSCPGFPTEKCGNQASNLYIYIKLSGQPLGTQGASSSSTANVSPSPSSNAQPPSSFSSSAAQPPPSSTASSRPPRTTTSNTPSQNAPATSATSASPSTTAGASSSDATPLTTPLTSVQVVTVSGVVVTQTVVSTPTFVSSPTSASAALNQTQKDGSNIGAIVGGVVGGIVGLAAVVGAVLLFLWRRRRRQNRDNDDDDDQGGVRRNTSTMSRAGLMRSEKPVQYPPQTATNLSHRNSRTLDLESAGPSSMSDRRASRPYILDQRLNPSVILDLDGASRASFQSMDDSRDYGRTLNVRNPDVDHD